MTNKQKGLDNALKGNYFVLKIFLVTILFSKFLSNQHAICYCTVLFPNAEHRHCVRHLHNNFKQKHPGEVLKQLMWNAARSTTVPWFNKHMDEMKMVKDKEID